MYMTGYQCLRCEKQFDADIDGMVCPSCGGNLDVRYDYNRLRRELAGRLDGTSHRPDIFRYLPFLPVKNLSLASSLRVGGTPLYQANRLGRLHQLEQLYIKDDGMNPTASFKDRAGAVALVKARELGAKVIAGASTGNAGSSMAGLCASVGQACVVFVPESAPKAKLLQLRSYGARVIAVRGSYDNAYDLCTELCRRHNWFNRNTGTNPFTREGKKTCSFEMWEQLGKTAPDRVVVSTGDGNIISGIWKGMLDLHRTGLIHALPKIDCVQAEGSAAVALTIHELRASNPAGAPIKWSDVVVKQVKSETLADSISVDVPRDGLAAVRAVTESNGEAIVVSDDAIMEAEIELASHAGIFTEPASAAAWAGIRQMAENGIIKPGERVVCLLTGNGLKDAGKIESSLPALAVVDPNPDDAASIVKDLT